MMEAEKQYLAMGMDKSISIEMPYTVSTDLGTPVEAFASVSITAADKDQASRIAKNAVQILNSRHQNLAKRHSSSRSQWISPICSVPSWTE